LREGWTLSAQGAISDYKYSCMYNNTIEYTVIGKLAKPYAPPPIADRAALTGSEKSASQGLFSTHGIMRL
jgi:hypothetical protein